MSGAFTVTSGGYPAISRARMLDASGSDHTINAQRATMDTPPDPLTTRQRPLYLLAGILGVIALITGVIYGLTVGLSDPHLVFRMLLFAALSITGTGSVVGFIAGLTVRANGEQKRLLKASLKRHTSEAVGDLPDVLQHIREITDLPDLLKDRSMEQAKVFTGLLDASCQRMGAELVQVRELVSAIGLAVEVRLDQLERRVDEQDEKIGDLRTIASVFAQSDGSGEVRQLRRPNGTPRPR